MTDTDIERIVMHRVHAVHALRPFLSAAAFGCLVLAFALYGIGREVWVAQVFANAPHANLAAAARFFAAAFLNTRFIVQVLVLLGVAAAVFVARECARALSSAAFLRRA